MNSAKIQRLLSNDNIIVSEIIENNKSSEKYIKTKFIQDDGFTWETYVPFYSRWSALFLEDGDEEKIADHLRSLKPYFTPVRDKLPFIRTNLAVSSALL